MPPPNRDPRPPRNPNHGGRPGGRPGGKFQGKPGGRPGGRPGGKPGGKGPRHQTTSRAESPEELARRLPDGIQLVHADRSVIVVGKPEGLACFAAGRTSVTSLVQRAVGGNPKMAPYAVGQIDRDASGVVVFSIGERARHSMLPQFEPDRGRRVYLALVEGEMSQEIAEGGTTLQHRIHKSTRGVADLLPEGTPYDRGVDAVAHVRVIASGDGLTLVQLRAETDYPYQPRAQLAFAGHPIVGDKTYNATRDDLGRLALHAAEVEIIHPRDDMKQRYHAPAPAEFWEAVGAKPPANAITAPTPPSEPEPTSSDPGWEHVASWYDDLIEHRRSDHHDEVVIPGAVRMLDAQPGQRVLDLACGQGSLCDALAAKTDGDPLAITGVDSSPSLIAAATERNKDATFAVGDARDLASLDLGQFDRVASVLALMNIDDLGAVFNGVASSLAEDGRFVFVVLHPSFRVPKSSHWGWIETDGEQLQFRRIDRYLSESSIDIVMNPGEVSGGAEPVHTVTHHRPLSAYADALRAAGLAIESIEEWTSNRKSEPGPRADAENTARAEFPLFLAVSAIRTTG